jgi:murein DD-endopeptidase MepM/ murein hydrolase activator NlpD
MIGALNIFLYKTRFLAVGTLVVACLLLLPFLPHLLWVDSTAQAANNHPGSQAEDATLNDSPNVITSVMFKGADGVERAAGSAEQAVNNSVRSTARSVASATVNSGRFLAHSLGSGVSLTGRAADSSARFIARGTANIFSSVTNTSIVGAVIRPGDKVSVSEDEPIKPALTRDHSSHSAEEIAPQPLLQENINKEASWPMNGTVTADFGVPHWPYQPTHTGIDISDQKSSGSTLIYPFKSGTVKETVRSKAGLGNHVVVDHGGGLTSVYAHLSTISVKVDQEVSKSTVLGYAGSTGASTGTHLHFEIRLNGQPVNPRHYISGQP